MSWAIREGRVEEVDRLVALRRAMFETMGHDDPAELDRVCDESRRYFAEEIPSGVFRIWVACVSGTDTVGAGDEAGSGQAGTCGGRGITSGRADDAGIQRGASSDAIETCEGEPSAPIEPDEGEPIASIGLVVHSVPPGPSNLAGKEGYIMNLVTLPRWQRMGIARALLTHVLDVLRAEGVPIASLHASNDGRSLYEDLGFGVRDALPEMRIRLS